jgi:formylglycine-generating enzyme required for sulfatase activity
MYRNSITRVFSTSIILVLLGCIAKLDAQSVNGKTDMCFNVNGVSFIMKYVEGGTFQMGVSTKEDKEADWNERPHVVKLDDFYIGETEVTQALWLAVMGENPSNRKGDGLPVESISWNDCQTFILKLSLLTGNTFRLPTEAEWEFSARGGNRCKGYKYSGSNCIDSVAWYDKNSGNLVDSIKDWQISDILNNYKLHLVKTKQQNELGLYDMSGNVWEWCQDWFGSYLDDTVNPQGATEGVYKILRGGSYMSNSKGCRVTNRYEGNPEKKGKICGLRLACGTTIHRKQ